MSVYIFAVCRTCGKRLQIGQARGGKANIYSAPKHAEAFSLFASVHFGHELVVLDDLHHDEEVYDMMEDDEAVSAQ
jgi:hypothetical protein